MLSLTLLLIPAYTLAVTGDVPHSLKLQLDDLRKLPLLSVPLKEHDGTTKNYQGVALTEVLKMAGVAVADHVRGKALAVCVEALAEDGYSVAFGLGEIEPSISGRTIILAYSADNQPLGPSVGPVRLVVGDDKKQARCERMVTEIHVIDLKQLPHTAQQSC
jgi:DMSO/TMAO reductase YedYZ molybdopterin-dependent catalytic subunit